MDLLDGKIICPFRIETVGTMETVGTVVTVGTVGTVEPVGTHGRASLQVPVPVPETHIKAGAKAHLFINYNACSGSSGMMVNNDDTNDNINSKSLNRPTNDSESVKVKADDIKIFPNPSHKKFTLASMQDIPIQSLAIFNLSGKLVHSEENIDAARHDIMHSLEGGTYLILITCVDGSIHRKKIVVQ